MTPGGGNRYTSAVGRRPEAERMEPGPLLRRFRGNFDAAA